MTNPEKPSYILDKPHISQEGYSMHAGLPIFDQAMLSRANQIAAHIIVIACK